MRARALLLALAFALLAWAAVQAARPSDKGEVNPHGFVNDDSRCDKCHEVVWKGNKGTLEENVFTVSFVDFCVECHPDNLSRSHPVNVDPYRTIKKSNYPDKLPLQTMEDGKTLMTCVTCHNPHSKRFSDKKVHVKQKEYPGHYGLFLTYYLRLGDHEADAGYMELCQSCHPDM